MIESGPVLCEVERTMTELGYFAPGSYATKLNEAAIPPEQINAVLQTCDSWEKLRTTKVVEPVSETWAERKQSNLVKFMMAGTGETVKNMGKWLGLSKGTLDSKLSRDCFSLTELIAIGYVCGCSFQVVDPDGEPFLIDPVDYLKTESPELLESIVALQEKRSGPEYAEYLQRKAELAEMKAKLAEMKEEYGFDD